MLWIISGPSSAGKSTFLASPRCREITGLGPETPVRYAFQRELTPGPGISSFLHYNCLRPAAQFQRQHPSPNPAEWQKAAMNFEGDRRWRAICELPVAKAAVVLVAEQATLIARTRARTAVEPVMPGHREHTYVSADWLALYAALDLPSIYAAWRAALAAAGIACHLVASDDPAFRTLSPQ